jgi:ribosomal protein S27E
MTDQTPTEDTLGSKSLLAQIDGICDRFESAWKNGPRPSIEEHLAGVSGKDQRDLFRALLAVEIEYRRKVQESPQPAEYQTRFPEFEEQIRAIFEAGQIPGNTDRTDPTIGHQLQVRALHIRCPHCHHPVELVDDRALEEITCPSCGSGFCLVGDEALAFQTDGGTLRRRQAFGHFELLEQLGAGAFGAVWKAHDSQLQRTVALKIPRKGQLTREETEKFLREARAAAQLRHPHIVSVYEVGVEGETVYLVSSSRACPWPTG